MASRSGVPALLLQQARVSFDQWPALTAAASSLGRLPVWVVERSALRADEMRSIVRQVKNECEKMRLPDGRRVDLAHVWVDYLQLMGSPAGPYEGRARAVAENARALKSMAKNFGCTFHALSQFSKAHEPSGRGRGVDDAGAAPARPRRTLNDRMDSTEIQKSADVVLFIERDEASLSGGVEDTQIRVMKSRQGPKAPVPMLFHGERMRLYELGEYGRGHGDSIPRQRHEPTPAARPKQSSGAYNRATGARVPLDTPDADDRLEPGEVPPRAGRA